MQIRRLLRAWKYWLLAIVLAFGIVACQQVKQASNFFVPKQSLAEVQALPLPQLPDWIEQISPMGEATPLSQIRVRFKDPLIPIEQLDSADQQATLNQFEISPALPGRFRFLTPRMVGFQLDQAIPKATRIKVTLKAGLADLKNHKLTQDLAWTFNTEAIQLTNLPTLPTEPDATIEPVSLEPKLEVTSNVELDPGSVKASLAAENSNATVPLNIALKSEDDRQDSEDDTLTPAEKFNPAERNWIYVLSPTQKLDKGTRYKLTLAPGMRPAKGNLPSETAFTGQVMTYGPLAFAGLDYGGEPDAGGAYGRFVRGSGLLKFNNGLVADSALKAVTIAPPPKNGMSPLRVYDTDRLIALNPWALEPDTTYQITIAPDLKDQFGQTLGKPVTITYKTGDVAADFWAPSGLNIFPANQNLQLNLSAVNLPKPEYRAAFRVLQPTDLVYTDTAYPRDQGQTLLPKPDQWKPIAFPKQTKNQTSEIPIPLREKLGGATGMLAYGVQTRTFQYEEKGANQWREPDFYGLVQLTNLGVFSQWFPESGLVRVHHLSDGSPVKGAQIEVYRSQLEAKSFPTPQACATGTTDPTGTFNFDLKALQDCLPEGKSVFDEPPQLLTIVHEAKDWSFSRTEDWSGAYGYGIYADWDGEKPESRGTIFSDRRLYQPGETAWFTGTAYYLKNGKLQQDKNVDYRLTLVDPQGSKTDLGSQTTNDFGTFSLSIPLKPNQPLGNYSLQAKAKNGVEIRGEFRVAEFKPPNFKVDLSLDRELVNMGDQVTAQAQSNYLFGPAVDGGKVEYYVTREKLDFVPKGWDEFSFGRRWLWPEEEPTVPSDVTQTTTNLSADGKGSQTVKVADDLPYPMQYRVDAQVTDVSNLSVANSKTFTALPSDRLIGLKSRFVADAGKPFEIQAIVTNPQGQAISGQSVRVELQTITYSSVTQVIEGSDTARDQIQYKTVDTKEIRSGDQPQTISLTPPESGSYRIRANFKDAKNDLTATDEQIWATGDNAVQWGSRYRNNRLELTLDKKTYQPGETANVVIQSPYPEAELYFAVIRHNTLYRTITKVKGGAPQIQFQVTPDMLPNAAIEAVLVRQGEPIEKLQPGQVDNLVRIGFAPFNTKLDNQYLQLKLTPELPSIAPGAEETLQLELKNAQGQPIKGQFTVMAVNEAVLQLTNYRLPDLVKTVYAEQAIASRFSDNRPNVVLTPLSSPIEKGWGFGGGLSSGAGSTRIRQDFKAVAYYNGSVITDANGKASVKFKTPDDLTTWRIMAVATDGNLHFGNADTTFMTTKPLMANPVLPQFSRVGDRFEAGLSVTNTTGQSGNLNIAGEISGAIQVADGKSATLQTQIGSGTNAYRFPIVANHAGDGTVKFTTTLGSTSDGFQVPLSVKALEVTEQVVETGTTETKAEIPLQIAPNVTNEAGGLDLSLASTLMPELQAPARQAFDDELLNFLEPAASQLSIAANLQLIAKTYGQTLSEFDAPAEAAKALQSLQKLQRPDGGFAFFPGQKTSDPFVSPYAAQALARVTAAKLTVDENLVDRLKAYLQKTLADPGQYDYCKTQRCKDQVRLRSLTGLAELGDVRNDFLADLYDRRAQFDPIDQIKLARYLSRFSDWSKEAQQLSQQIEQTIYTTGRTATINLPRNWRWFSSPVTAQSEALRLFVARKQSQATLDKLLSALLSLRRNGTWGCSYYNAQALSAIAEYSQKQTTPPNFSAKAVLNGKELLSADFQGYQKPSANTTISMADLPRGAQTLTLSKSGQGTLHYLAAYRYRLQGNPPGRFNGLRITRSIHPANKTDVLSKMDLQTVQDPLRVKSGQVFDVELEIIADHPVDHVVINDPLPAGFEAVDTSFQTSTPYFQARSDSWEIGYQTIYHDRVMAYGNHLEAGVYTMHYLVRSVTPGTFLYPGAEVHLQYAPEELGRSATSTLTIAD